MWSKIVSKITGLLSSFLGSYAGLIFNILTYGAVFLSGVYVTYLYYDHQIQVIQNESIQAVSDIKSKSIIELQNREKETAKIISERDDEKAKHDSDVRELNALIDRLQHGESGSSKSVSPTSSSSAKSTEELFRRGQELQKKCYRLLERGVDLSGRISADKDAVVKMTTTQINKKESK